jgi:hypothetical protein
MAETTSSEFVEWIVLLEEEEWEETTKLEHYQAAIIRELRQIQQMFAKSPRLVPLDECFLKFKEATGENGQVGQHPEQPKLEPIQLGDLEAAERPEWKIKAERAKVGWAKILGMKKSGDSYGYDTRTPTRKPSGQDTGGLPGPQQG